MKIKRDRHCTVRSLTNLMFAVKRKTDERAARYHNLNEYLQTDKPRKIFYLIYGEGEKAQAQYDEAWALYRALSEKLSTANEELLAS